MRPHSQGRGLGLGQAFLGVPFSPTARRVNFKVGAALRTWPSSSEAVWRRPGPLPRRQWLDVEAAPPFRAPWLGPTQSSGLGPTLRGRILACQVHVSWLQPFSLSGFSSVKPRPSANCTARKRSPDASRSLSVYLKAGTLSS